MPCTDGGVPYDTAPRHNTEAMLCAIVRAAEKLHLTEDLISRADWGEAGVSAISFKGWLEEHRRADESRRQRELEEARRNALKRAALEKLSPEERRLLGL